METYKRANSFSAMKDPAQSNPKIDRELDAVGISIAALAERLDSLQNDDGTLKAGVVDAKAIGRDISLTPGSAEEWRADTLYPSNMLVYRENATYYCLRKHKSSADFEEDRANWETIVDFNPVMDRLKALAGSPHIVRVGKNMDALVAIAENTPRLMELSQNLDRLMQIVEKLPLLDQFISDKGEPILRTVFDNLDVLRVVAENEAYVQKVAVARDEVENVSRIVVPIMEVAKALQDIRDVVKFMRQIQTMAVGANTPATGA